MGCLSSRIDEDRTTGQGTRYRFLFWPGAGLRNPPILEIAVPAASWGDFRVTAESRLDRLGKRFGVVRTIATGDPDFDRRWYVSTDTPLFAEMLFGNLSVRDAVRRVFAAGFTQLGKNGSELSASWVPFRDEPSSIGSESESAAEELQRIARMLPVGGYPGDPACMSSRSRRIAASLFTIGLAIAGLISLVVTLSSYPPVDATSMFLSCTCWCGLPGFLLSALALILFLRGRTSAHREMAVLLPAALAAWTMLGYGGPGTINGALDRSPEVMLERVITDTHRSSGRHGSCYSAVVSTGRSTGTSFSISRSLYDEIQPGRSRAQIVTRAGRLGFEWQVAVRFLP